MTPAFVAVARGRHRAGGDHRDPPAGRRGRDGQLHLRHRRRTARSSGSCRCYRLLLSPGETPVRELMAPSTVRVRADADREVAARLLTDRNLLALPVVDDADHLLGIITEDDVADVLEAEATEDIERLGGSEPLNAPYRSSGVLLLVRKRVVWLLLLFVAEAYTGTVLRDFQDELHARWSPSASSSRC